MFHLFCKLFPKFGYGQTTQRIKFIKHYSTVLKRMPSGLMTVGSEKVEVEIIGDGNKCIFFMPGGLGTLRLDFARQLEYLDKKKFTIIGWSPPGCGLSPPSRKPYGPDTPKEHAELAAGLLMKLGLRQLNVVGWCFGGVTSVIMTANNPDLTKKLLLIAPWITLHQKTVNNWQKFRDIKTWDPVVIDRLIDLYGYYYTQENWKAMIDVGHIFVNEWNGNVAIEECKRIKCPTLVVHCEDDQLIPYKLHAQFTTSLIKNSRLVTMKSGGHAVQISSAETFNRILEEFLKS